MESIKPAYRCWINDKYVLMPFDKVEDFLRKNRITKLDGPAVICHDGTKWWYKNGLGHRDDGPAIEWPDGSELWLINGIHHRSDGPAKIMHYKTDVGGNNDAIEWWIHGELYSYEINEWIEEKGLPDWRLWDNEIKILFKLTWC